MAKAAVLFLTSMVLGCGGNVFVDGSSDDASTAAGSPQRVCESVCQKINGACPDGTLPCGPVCAEIAHLSASKGCDAEASSYFACLDEDPSFACTHGDATCQPEESAYLNCTSYF